MRRIDFNLNKEYIELIKLLKLLNFEQSVAHAKILVEEGEVKLNDQTEHRKRAKVKSGDIVQCGDTRIFVTGNSTE